MGYWREFVKRVDYNLRSQEWEDMLAELDELEVIREQYSALQKEHSTKENK